MNIKVINHTKNPLTVMGTLAAECYNTTLKDENHAKRIAQHCIRSGHGRNMEFGDITITVEGLSARCIREIYTHIIGTSRTQSSTRYIDYADFPYHSPEMTEEQEVVYDRIMKQISDGYKELKELGAANDVTGYVLPLAMESTFNLKINARALEHMAEIRTCNRALKEFRDFIKALKKTVADLDEEWEWIANNCMRPKCIRMGFCDEDYSCGMMPKKTS